MTYLCFGMKRSWVILDKDRTNYTNKDKENCFHNPKKKVFVNYLFIRCIRLFV
jgi:hypothetical protein